MQNKRYVLLPVAVATLGIVVLAVCLGANQINLVTTLQALWRGRITPEVQILIYVRAPRVAGAVLAGAGFAASGAIIQVVLANPLASPNVIGVNTGAGLFVLIAHALFAGVSPITSSAAAFFGALFASVLVLAMSAGNRISPVTVVLGGFAISSILGAGMNSILLVYPDAYVGAGGFLAGGLSGLGFELLGIPALCIGAGLLAGELLAGAMNVLALGADTASALGVKVSWLRFWLLLIAAVLAGAAVSFSGMIGFVGLVAPHAARFLAGQNNRIVLPLSALVGAGLVTLCDLVGRVVFAPYELPVGILMPLFGGPFFLYLIYRNRRNLQ